MLTLIKGTEPEGREHPVCMLVIGLTAGKMRIPGEWNLGL